MKSERTISAWHAIGGLIGWVAWMGLVFAGCLAWFEARPTRGTARAFRILTWVAIAPLVVFAAGLLWHGARAIDLLALVVVTWFLTGIAVAFHGAYRYAERVNATRVDTDPVAHWSNALREGERWTLRVRAARELGRLLPEYPELRGVLRAQYEVDHNHRVRETIRHALSRGAAG
ncbi:MAG: hypothetical protein QNJ98_06345 [Planctomycetota bacterium]|nr:hypothetical protein [Planctomycetota bacterium]